MEMVARATAMQWLARSRAWIGIALIAPVAVMVVLSMPLSAINSWGDFAFDVSGWLTFFLGAGFRWWATLYIGDRKSRGLVRHGPYSVCRNPLYFGTICMCMSIGFLVQSLCFELAVLVAAAFYLGVTVPVEEARLAALFGEEYAAYCRRVPRFVPRIKLYETPHVLEVRVAGLHAELVRTLRWIWIPIVCHLLTHLRAQDWWPALFTLP